MDPAVPAPEAGHVELDVEGAGGLVARHHQEPGGDRDAGGDVLGEGAEDVPGEQVLGDDDELGAGVGAPGPGDARSWARRWVL